MSRSKAIITLGAFVALLPLLGFPHSWESIFEVLSGLSIVGLVVWTMVDKKLTQKAKAQRRHAARRALADIQNANSIEESPIDYHSS